MSDRSHYPTIAEQLGSVPDAPGVYLWKDEGGEVLYVGKAKSLRKRMRQYVAEHITRVPSRHLSVQEILPGEYC